MHRVGAVHSLGTPPHKALKVYGTSPAQSQWRWSQYLIAKHAYKFESPAALNYPIFLVSPGRPQGV